MIRQGRNSTPSPTPSERTVSSKHSSVNLEGSLFFPRLKDERIPTLPCSSELHSPQPPIPTFDLALTSFVQSTLSNMPSLPNPNDRKAPSFSADEPENLPRFWEQMVDYFKIDKTDDADARMCTIVKYTKPEVD